MPGTTSLHCQERRPLRRSRYRFRASRTQEPPVLSGHHSRVRCLKLLRFAPLGDPMQVKVGGSFISIRKSEAAIITVDIQ